MLHLIFPKTNNAPSVTLADIFAHRKNFQESEQSDINQNDEWCSFNTHNITYLAYQSPSYGLVGSAKLVPYTEMPPSLSSFIETESAFILSDCLFHLPEKSQIFKAPDFVVRKNFSDLLELFYGSLIDYLEIRALKEKMPLIYFYLSEEDFDFISQYSGRDICVKKEINNGPGLENSYFGAIDFSDLIYEN